jgi:hypothetical protein
LLWPLRRLLYRRGGLSQPSGGTVSGGKRLGVLTPTKEEPFFYKYRATALMEGFSALGKPARGERVEFVRAVVVYREPSHFL